MCMISVYMCVYVCVWHVYGMCVCVAYVYVCGVCMCVSAYDMCVYRGTCVWHVCVCAVSVHIWTMVSVACIISHLNF